MTGFGAGWWLLGCSAVAGSLGWGLRGGGLVVVVLLGVAAWRAREPGSGLSPETGRRFGLVFAAEGVVIFLVVVGANVAGRQEWIPALITIVVGLHFLPLARLFEMLLYGATGAVLVLLGVGTLLASGAGLSDAAMRGVPGFGAAVVLWATSGVLASGRLAGARPDAAGSGSGGSGFPRAG